MAASIIQSTASIIFTLLARAIQKVAPNLGVSGDGDGFGATDMTRWSGEPIWPAC